MLPPFPDFQKVNALCGWHHHSAKVFGVGSAGGSPEAAQALP